MTSTVAKEKELYSGKASGLTFEAFDEKVITWCRKKYGDTYTLMGYGRTNLMTSSI
jgi:hypothetical protein